MGIKSKIFTAITNGAYSRNELNTLCLNYEKTIGTHAVANYIEYQEIKKQDEEKKILEDRTIMVAAILDSITDTETEFYNLNNKLKKCQK